MQPLKKTHLCVLKKYLAVAALSCAASVISVKSIADNRKDLKIHLTAEVPEKEFKLENEDIALTMVADKANEIFKGETNIRYLNHEKVQSLKVTLYKSMNPVLNPESVETIQTIGIESILINYKELVGSLGVDLAQNELNSFNQKIPLEITSESYENAPAGNYTGTVILQFDATISS
ncbi:hypothetical protein [Candidatus Williamhamiltonella defendens]|uniref:Uncharacterized protein n=1 Tax=Candidatus Hamiltonella defensa (Bemisia tabaci) TaxID=672795 RepID=A0A249DYY8_9ENTR|nr:hypothetical protein [Candidatus Hamiltonella defensa]ASX26756.1 hypothetical protein BA171_06945 [Candidatus Hamiltonella defensa (Bemisia tabaci)]CED79341.1 Conserved hypothetical protein [Candidatus Hamiltonella defensa (Bemisia tabaci)]